MEVEKLVVAVEKRELVAVFGEKRGAAAVEGAEKRELVVDAAKGVGAEVEEGKLVVVEKRDEVAPNEKAEGAEKDGCVDELPTALSILSTYTPPLFLCTHALQ